MSGYQQPWEFQSAQLGPSTATNLGLAQPQVGFAYKYNKMMVVISGLATETISVSYAPDPGSASAALARPIDVATGALAAASALGNGTYLFDISGVYSLGFTKSAGVDNATVRYSLSRYS